MNYDGHRDGGIIVGMAVAFVTVIISDNIQSTFICCMTTCIFALYPDLDIASKPSRYAFLVGIPAIIYFALTGHPIEALLTFLFISVPKVFPHRGLVHTLKFGLLATVCWIFILMPFVEVNPYFILGSGMIGYLTHLILDKHVRL